MSSEPPPPPQVSPDGKVYWDGQRWVPTIGAEVLPLQRQATIPAHGPPAYTAPAKGHALRNVSLGCLGLIVVLIVIGITRGGSNTSSSSPTSSSPGSQSGPQGDNISNIAWTVGSAKITFDYAPAQSCSALSFHYSFVDASSNELGSVDGQPSAFLKGSIYHITFFMLRPFSDPGLDKVPPGTDRVNITPHCG